MLDWLQSHALWMGSPWLRLIHREGALHQQDSAFSPGPKSIDHALSSSKLGSLTWYKLARWWFVLIRNGWFTPGWSTSCAAAASSPSMISRGVRKLASYWKIRLEGRVSFFWLGEAFVLAQSEGITSIVEAVSQSFSFRSKEVMFAWGHRERKKRKAMYTVTEWTQMVQLLQLLLSSCHCCCVSLL